VRSCTPRARRAIRVAATIAALAFVAKPAAAQTTLTIRLPVKDVMSLDASSSALVFPSPNAAAYDQSAIPVSSGLTLTVRSNRKWKVTLSSAANFTFANTGSNTFANPAKPASDVSWGTTTTPFSSSGTLGLTGGSVPFTGTGLSGAPTSYNPIGAATATVFFRPTWSYVRDVPGTYTLVVNLTLSTP
jgi:hypothetical protein